WGAEKQPPGLNWPGCEVFRPAGADAAIRLPVDFYQGGAAAGEERPAPGQKRLSFASPAGLVGCHCVAAYAGLRPWPSLRDGVLRPSAAGIGRGGIPLWSPLAPVRTDSCLIKPNTHIAQTSH